jgi:hypothetical protein
MVEFWVVDNWGNKVFGPYYSKDSADLMAAGNPYYTVVAFPK